MIRRVALEHWKSIEKLDLELGPLTVIVGVNGSGKSNFVDALCFVRDTVTVGLDQAVAQRRGFGSLSQWAPGKPHELSMRLEVSEPGEGPGEAHGFLSFTLASSTGNAYFVAEEEGRWGPLEWSDSDRLDPGDHYFRSTYYSRDRDGKMKTEPWGDSDQSWPKNELGVQNTLYLCDPIRSFEAYTIHPAILRQPQPPYNKDRLLPTGANLMSVFKALSESKEGMAARREILDAMKPIMPSLEEIHIDELGGLLMPMFEVAEVGGARHKFNAAQISDGTLRALGILTALYHPGGPDVIALEEPEQTLHPGVLAVLAEAMEDVCERRQILVTTHSPHLVDHFDPDCIYTAEMTEGVTTIHPISADQMRAVREHLFSLGELMTIEGLHS